MFCTVVQLVVLGILVRTDYCTCTSTVHVLRMEYTTLYRYYPVRDTGFKGKLYGKYFSSIRFFFLQACKRLYIDFEVKKSRSHLGV